MGRAIGGICEGRDGEDILASLGSRALERPGPLPGCLRRGRLPRRRGAGPPPARARQPLLGEAGLPGQQPGRVSLAGPPLGSPRRSLRHHPPAQGGSLALPGRSAGPHIGCGEAPCRPASAIARACVSPGWPHRCLLPQQPHLRRRSPLWFPVLSGRNCYKKPSSAFHCAGDLSPGHGYGGASQGLCGGSLAQRRSGQLPPGRAGHRPSPSRLSPFRRRSRADPGKPILGGPVGQEPVDPMGRSSTEGRWMGNARRGP